MLYFSPSAKTLNVERAAESGRRMDDEVLSVLADEDIRDLKVRSGRQEIAESSRALSDVIDRSPPDADVRSRR